MDSFIIKHLGKNYSEILIEIHTFVIEDKVNHFVFAALHSIVNDQRQKKSSLTERKVSWLLRQENENWLKYWKKINLFSAFFVLSANIDNSLIFHHKSKH